MESIEERLHRYSLLSPAERAEVDAYVARHPERAAQWEAARAWDHLFRQARRLVSQPVDDEALAFLVMLRALGGRPQPTHLADAVAVLAERVREDPDLQARYRTLQGRLADLEREGDAVAQFERLTGHRLEASPPARVAEAATSYQARVAAPKAAADAEAEAHTPAEPPQPVADRPPVPRVGRRRTWLRRTGAAVATLMVGYGLLFGVSQATRSELHQLASVEAYHGEIEQYDRLRLRSGSGRAADDQFLEGLRTLRGAERTYLGLFPHFDAAALQQASTLLSGVAAQESTASSIRFDAHFYLAKARMALGDVDGAQAALRVVVSGGGPKAPAAAALLDALRVEM